MIHELREYVALPGRAEELHRRFADRTLELWREIGLDLVGFWHVSDEPRRIVYLVRFATEDEARSHWEAFTRDPRWLQIKGETEADGPLIESISSTYLATPAYFRAPDPLPSEPAAL